MRCCYNHMALPIHEACHEFPLALIVACIAQARTMDYDTDLETVCASVNGPARNCMEFSQSRRILFVKKCSVESNLQPHRTPILFPTPCRMLCGCPREQYSPSQPSANRDALSPHSRPNSALWECWYLLSLTPRWVVYTI